MELSALKSSNNVEVKRLAERAGFFSSVENRDLLNCFGESFNKLVSAERSVKTNLNKTELCAVFLVEEVNCFLNSVADRTHSNDYVVCVGSAVVVEELVVCAYLLVDLVHVILNNRGELVVELVTSLTSLEEDIAVLSSTAEYGVFRVQRTVTESLCSFLVEHILEVLVIPSFNFLNLVGSTETVEEVEYRYSALDR